MAVADCGWGMVFGMNAQAAGDLAAITRRAAEDCSRPFMNVQDGFLTTHTVETVRLPEKDLLKEYVGSPSDRLTSLFDPYNPIMTGTVQNQDSYMKGKIAQRAYYDEMMPALKSAMADMTSAIDLDGTPPPAAPPNKELPGTPVNLEENAPGKSEVE